VPFLCRAIRLHCGVPYFVVDDGRVLILNIEKDIFIHLNHWLNSQKPSDRGLLRIECTTPEGQSLPTELALLNPPAHDHSSSAQKLVPWDTRREAMRPESRCVAQFLNCFVNKNIYEAVFCFSSG
jgi:hypothetical protein